MNAAKQISGYNEKENTYIHPSVAMKIGHSVLQCANILESQIIIEDSNPDKLQKEWKFSVSSNAYQDLNKKKFNKPVTLPDAKYITILHAYISNELSTGVNLIKNGTINQNYYKMVCSSITY